MNGVVEAARAQGITRLRLYPSGRISTFRQVKNGGASGPDLDDYEAAILIANGWDWSVVDVSR